MNGYRPAGPATLLLLNLWFIVALGLASSLHRHAHITSYTWAQVVAWAGGPALWIAVTFTVWLVRGRHDRPLIFVDLPQPSSYAAEGYRVLWMLCGAGIGALVMALAHLLTGRTAGAPAQPPTRQPA
jgi:hypothetical protein